MKKNGSVCRQAGFTLMEMLASIAILMILTIVAVGMFSRSLRSSAYVESERLVDGSSKVVIDAMSRHLRESTVVTLDSSDKTTCLSAGSITGSSLVMIGLDGYQTTYSLSDGNISSNSSIMNPSSVAIQSFGVVWTCTSGQPDQLDVNFTSRVAGMSEGLDSGIKTKSYSFGVTLRNSND